MAFTTAFPTSQKSELPSCLHNFCAQVTPTGNVATGSSLISAVSSMTGIGLGSTITGTGIPAGSFVANIASATSLSIGGAGNATATNTGVTLTIGGHVFKIALGVAVPVGSFGAATGNYSSLGSDEVANGNGYTTGGFTFTNAGPVTNITPANNSPGGINAWWQWSINPSWTASTFSTSGCIIYNSSSTNRAVYVGSFGGTQTVNAGTLTLLQPTNGATTSLLQLN